MKRGRRKYAKRQSRAAFWNELGKSFLSRWNRPYYWFVLSPGLKTKEQVKP